MAAGARQPRSEQGSRGEASSTPEYREPLAAGCEIAGCWRLESPLGLRRTVWLARDAAGQACAIKQAPPVAIAHEARILAKLDHPNLVRMLARAESPAGPVLVLEYLAGGDLVSLAGAAPAHWLRPLAELIEAVDFLHAQGLVHRDLKARNVMFSADRQVRFIDFGSAALAGSVWTDGGTTADAVAPQREDAPVAAADNVYALAALVHELLHGAPPGKSRPRQAAVGTAAAALAAVVEDCLVSRQNAARMGLEGFRTVIESLRER